MLRREIATLREQWDAAINRSIANDLRILELTDREMVDFSAQCTPTESNICQSCNGVLGKTSSVCSASTQTEKLIIEEGYQCTDTLGSTQKQDGATQTSVENGEIIPHVLPYGLDKSHLDLLLEENVSLMDQIISIGSELEKARKIQSQMEDLTVAFNTSRSEHLSSCDSPTNVDINVRIWADSHGRGINDALDKLLPSNYKSTTHIAPGAPMEIVIENMLCKREIESTKSSDYVVLIGGTNSFSADGNTEDLLKNFTERLVKVIEAYKHTNFILTTVPYRYDLRENSIENIRINRINRVIRNIPKFYQGGSVKIVSVWAYERSLHTGHGLHLNKRGKRRLAWDIYKKVVEKSFGKVFRKHERELRPEILVENGCNPSITPQHGSFLEE
ncbi:uncharacterized protein LOC120350671 [Nilaparvata lugens]|uniref:uncharacterized protein LOC120350671 n=1 Tax=Nilaparvata lugens TaxID=108931 RepID=UPI00193D14E9|nr:uncharacterized protein LOC120350671 [Nilaparvata lugens]